MKESFVSTNFSPDKLEQIERANEIIANYQAQGLKLTLRQLYYQHVVRNYITNEEKSYKRLGKLLSDARLAGLTDWDAIEDRVRVPVVPSQWDSLEDILESVYASFRLPRWENQSHYAELWVEKDALSGVLRPMAREFHVTMMVNKGYSSQSAMYEASKRFIEAEERGQTTRLFYLGDHDPSGEDMVRDIQDRLETFGSEVIVTKIALTMPQIVQYNPPPNPAKMSDSRADKYVAKHGAESWEVDALPPEALQDLIREALESVVDAAKMNAVMEREETEKKLLRKAVKNLRGTNA
jgi:hypothetical protein